MKDTVLYVLFISAIVALFAFAFSFSQDKGLDGKTVFVDSKCTTCHSVSSMEITSKKDEAVDLSNAASLGDADFLKSYLMKETKINDKEHKLKFKGSDEELKSLVDWLLTLKTESEG
jgi:cytochrome c5